MFKSNRVTKTKEQKEKDKKQRLIQEDIDKAKKQKQKEKKQKSSPTTTLYCSKCPHKPPQSLTPENEKRHQKQDEKSYNKLYKIR